MCACIFCLEGRLALSERTRAIHFACSSYCAKGTTFQGRPTKDIEGARSGGKMCWYRCSILQTPAVCHPLYLRCCCETRGIEGRESGGKMC